MERKFACQLDSYATKGDKVSLASLISGPFQLPLVFQYANVCEGKAWETLLCGDVISCRSAGLSRSMLLLTKYRIQKNVSNLRQEYTIKVEARSSIYQK